MCEFRGAGVHRFLGCRVWRRGRTPRGAVLLVFSLVLAVGLVLVVLLRDWLKNLLGVLRYLQRYAEIGWHDVLLEPHQHLQGPGPRQDRTACGEHTGHGRRTQVPGALAAALTAASQPMQLVDVFDLLFGRNAAVGGAAARRDAGRCGPDGARPVGGCGRCCRWSSCGRRRCCPKRCAAQ